MNTNCLGHIALVKGFLPLLQKSQGQVVDVSSIAGLVGVTFRTCYSASKFGISGFSQALRAEVK